MVQVMKRLSKQTQLYQARPTSKYLSVQNARLTSFGWNFYQSYFQYLVRKLSNQGPSGSVQLPTGGRRDVKRRLWRRGRTEECRCLEPAWASVLTTSTTKLAKHGRRAGTLKYTHPKSWRSSRRSKKEFLMINVKAAFRATLEAEFKQSQMG